VSAEELELPRRWMLALVYLEHANGVLRGTTDLLSLGGDHTPLLSDVSETAIKLGRADGRLLQVQLGRPMIQP